MKLAFLGEGKKVIFKFLLILMIIFSISKSVSDTVNTASESTSSNANYPPVAPPRTKRGAPKASTIHTNKALGASSKSPTAQHLKPQGKKLLQFFIFFIFLNIVE